MANGPEPSVGLTWFAALDPTIAPGIAAPMWQLLIRTDTSPNSFYWKSGPGATDWSLVGSGGGSGSNIIQLVNDNGAPIVICTPVYSDAPNGMNLGIANNSGKSQIVGLVSDTSVAPAASGNVAVGGIMVATTAQWDAVCGTAGGLTFNTIYYLDPAVAGKLTSAAPIVAGQEVVQVAIGLSPTKARIAVQPPILL